MIYHQPGNSMGGYRYNAFFYQNTAYDSHFHKNLELIYVLRGTVEAVIQGTPRRLTQGEMLLLTPNLVHAFTVSGESLAWVGVFSRDFVPAFAKERGGRSFAPFRCDSEVETFLRQTLFQPEPPELCTLTGCLYLACGQCLRHASPLKGRLDSRLADAIIAYVAGHFTENITLKEVADALGYEYHYFSKVFHDCFQMNFRDFISIYRVEAACGLLADASKELTQVALESGFQSIRNFNRIFKKLCGITPGEYQRRD